MGIPSTTGTMNSRTYIFTMHCLVVLCLATILWQTGRVSAAPQKIVEEDGSNYDEDDCRKAAKKHSTSCAVIFENEECDDGLLKLGWDYGISTGYTKFGLLDRKREDSESVIVSPGCVFFGYDEDHSDKSERGKGIMVSAVGKNDWVYKEFESETFDLRDDIEAVECFCGTNATLATQVKPIPLGKRDKVAGFFGVGTAKRHCNTHVHAFNRLPTNERPCAILFESDDCETNDKPGPLKLWYKEILPSNKITNLAEWSFSGAKADSAESVLVRPGCTFVGFDENDGNKGNKGAMQITVKAPPGSIPTHQEFEKLFQSDLDEDIAPFKCTC